MAPSSAGSPVPALLVPKGTHVHEGARVIVGNYKQFHCGFCDDQMSVAEISEASVDANAFPLLCYRGPYDALRYNEVVQSSDESKVLAKTIRGLKKGVIYDLTSLYESPVIATETAVSLDADHKKEATSFAQLLGETDEIAFVEKLFAGAKNLQAAATRLLFSLQSPRWRYDPKVAVDDVALDAWAASLADEKYVASPPNAKHVRLIEAVRARRVAILRVAERMLLESDEKRFELGLDLLRSDAVRRYELDVFRKVDLERLRGALHDAAERYLSGAEKDPLGAGTEDAIRNVMFALPDGVQRLGCTDVARAMKIAGRLEALTNGSDDADLREGSAYFLADTLYHARAPEGVHALIAWLDAHPKSTERGRVLGSLGPSLHPDALSWLLAHATGSDGETARSTLAQFREKGGRFDEISAKEAIKLRDFWLKERPKGYSPLTAKLADEKASKLDLPWAYWAQTGKMFTPDECEANGKALIADLPKIAARTDLDDVKSHVVVDAGHAAAHKEALELVAHVTPERLGAAFAKALGTDDDAGKHRSAISSWVLLSMLESSSEKCGFEQDPKTPRCAIALATPPLDGLMKFFPVYVEGTDVPKDWAGLANKKGVLVVPLAFAIADLRAYEKEKHSAVSEDEAERLRAVLGLFQIVSEPAKSKLERSLEKLAEHLTGEAAIKARPGAGLLAHIASADVVLLLRSIAFIHLDPEHSLDEDEGWYPLRPFRFSGEDATTNAIASFLSEPTLPAPEIFATSADFDEKDFDAVIEELTEIAARFPSEAKAAPKRAPAKKTKKPKTKKSS